MENAKHVFEGAIYLLNNISVARNPLFRNQESIERFKEKADIYLSPICNILAFAFNDNQWQLLVQMKSREDFINFYRKKHKNENIEEFLIPESSIIYSQEMANLQSGFAKHYNWLNKRVGALFYRRYQKQLITSEEELISTNERLKKERPNNPHKGEWAIRKSENLKSEKGMRWGINYEKLAELGSQVLWNGIQVNKTDLEAHFRNLPPLKIENSIYRYFRLLFKILSYFEVPIW